MAKKKAATSKSAASKKRASKHIEALGQLGRDELEEYFEKTPSFQLLQVFEESYPSDLVGLLLDLRRSVVRQLFERLYPLRKKTVLPVMVQYHYSEYLTNPLPLEITSLGGEQVPNWYAVLGAPRDAGDEDLKEAHRFLVKAFGEDAVAPEARSASEQRLKEITTAYGKLKDPKRRAATDAVLPNISYLYPRREHFWLEAVRRLMG